MPDFDCDDCGKPVMYGLRALQRDILEAMARDLPVARIMDQLCRRVSLLAPEAICSILAVDADDRLQTLAAPGLPENYSAAVNGLRVGPTAGSCGTAAFLGKPVEVTDIATDPLWTAFRGLALPLGLRACWSSPIHAADGRVVGTFAFYYRACRGPTELERRIVETCVHLCAIALEQDERKARIERLAYYDALTGAANRFAFEERCRESLMGDVSESNVVAIHWIDLDNFKSVNDTLGHQAGDTLLRTLSRRFAAELKDGEFLARIGGDEFVVLQTGVRSIDCIENLARRLARVASEPVDLDGREASVSASIGIARGPQDGSDPSELMKKADLALYEAKAARQKGFSFYNHAIATKVASSWQVEQDLKQAIVLGEFELHVQPIVSLERFELAGFEALLRWRRPGHGLIGPAAFLDVAEKSGLITQIGDWVLGEACRSCARLPAQIRMAVNLSPTQLTRPGFALSVASALSMAGLSPERLELEITESALLLENAQTLACLNDLSALGVSIALDDFGTGFSALSHLRAFPVDRVKIDRSFVKDIDVNRETASIVRAIVGLAHDLGVKTTAEGVETEAQLRMINSFGCDEIQGYLVSKPKACSAFDVFGEETAEAKTA